ncbi:MAG: sugar phosphate nucleotidyltransferase, partial [Chlamydiota bacterium]|nr:sugar phosphate nucleotidyltransferase [Chlamydiota bacterium]
QGRNTAPCLALAARFISLQEEDAVMIALPADHYIKDNDGFVKVLKLACKGALDHDALVTIGIVPDKPETGYGYIQYAKSDQDSSLEGLHRVLRFVEKPDFETAQHYVDEGTYLWNSGMIIFHVHTFMESLKLRMKDLFNDVSEIRSVLKPEELKQEIFKMYKKTEKISIDYGLLEKADNILVAKGDFGWDDIGSFASIERHHNRDSMNNVCIGDAALLDCQDCTIVSEDGMIGVIGLRDIIVVRSGNAVIVLPKDRAQDVKKVVGQIKDRGLGRRYL